MAASFHRPRREPDSLMVISVLQRLRNLLAMLLGLTLLAAEPLSAAVWHYGQKVASGSVAVLELPALEQVLLSAERIGEISLLTYKLASGSPVAARAGGREATGLLGSKRLQMGNMGVDRAGDITDKVVRNADATIGGSAPSSTLDRAECGRNYFSFAIIAMKRGSARSGS
jgi:hypothetical protein